MASLDRKPALRLSILDSGQGLVPADLERPGDRVQASVLRSPGCRSRGRAWRTSGGRRLHVLPRFFGSLAVVKQLASGGLSLRAAPMPPPPARARGRLRIAPRLQRRAEARMALRCDFVLSSEEQDSARSKSLVTRTGCLSSLPTCVPENLQCFRRIIGLGAAYRPNSPRAAQRRSAVARDFAQEPSHVSSRSVGGQCCWAI